MNIIEFQNRVNVTVTPEEYEHIEAVYMASDLDKDDFCAMWRKMNRSRVIAAAESRKRQRAIDRILDEIMRNAIWHGYVCLTAKAVNVLNESTLDAIEQLDNGRGQSIEFYADGSGVCFTMYHPTINHGCPGTVMRSFDMQTGILVLAGHRMKSHYIPQCL